MSYWPDNILVESTMQDPIRRRLTLSRGFGHPNPNPDERGVGIYLAPGQCATFHTSTHIEGRVVVRHCGAPEIKLEEARIQARVIEIEKLMSEGVPLGLAQNGVGVAIAEDLTLHLKNTSPGKTLFAYPLMTLDATWEYAEKHAKKSVKKTERFVLGAALIKDTAPTTIFLAPGENACLHHEITMGSFLPEKWLVHCDAPPGALAVEDLKVGKNSQLPFCHSLPASFFSETTSPRLSGNKATLGQNLTMYLSNKSRQGIYLQAEVEGLAFEKEEEDQ